MDFIRVVQVSGGKDSQAVAKLIRNRFPDDRIIGLFCDTKFEHPFTYDHVHKIANLYDLDLIILNNGSVPEQVEKWKRFPGGGARHCTEYLKIKPAKDFLIELSKSNPESTVVNYLGVRSDESSERKKRYDHVACDDLYMPHEVMPSKCPKYMGEKLGIRYCLPIIDWSSEEVFGFLNGDENPLYAEGFDRVGCFPCMAGGDKWKLRAFNFDVVGEKHYQIMKKLEAITVSAGNNPIFSTGVGVRGEATMNSESGGQGCLFCSM